MNPVRKLALYGVSLVVLCTGLYELLRDNHDPLLEVSWHADPELWDVGKMCIGYDGRSRTFGGEQRSCPPNHAFIAEVDPGGRNKGGPGIYVPLSGNCCPLPFDDILTEEHIYNVEERCPDNYIATGGSPACGETCYMRCTRINSVKYQLGQERMSYFWATGNAYGQGATKKIRFDQIPAAIRWSVGRIRHGDWSGGGCVGVPFGSLLVRKSKKTCDGFYHRQLQYRDGKPVPMFPKCDAVSDVFDPNATCVREGQGRAQQSAQTPLELFPD